MAASTQVAGPKKGGTLILGKSSGIQQFNPFNTAQDHYPYFRALYNTLVHYDRQLNPQPDLAEDWIVSPDGKAITLKLRQGVRFHSGREFTSADVKFSLEFAQTDERTVLKPLFKTVKQIEASELYTAAFRFETANPGMFDLLHFLFIIDKETIADRAKSAIGTGPFKLERYIPNDTIEFVAFKDYWDKGKPYLDKYVIRTIPDVSALVVNLESGAVDCISRPNYVDVPRLKEAGGRYVVDMGAPGGRIFNLAINTKAKPFTDKKVRQAMAWAMDRARFCRTALQGLVNPTCLIWPPNSWGYFADLQGKVGFDLDRARALLKEAGLENGFDTELITSTKSAYGMTEFAQIFQADLKKIGVNCKIIDLESAQYQARGADGKIIMMVHNYGRGNVDPGSTLTGAKAWYTEREGAWTHFESPEYDRLRQELQSTMDREKRKTICRKIQELALDECFTNPFAESPSVWVHASYVKGFSYYLEDSPVVGEIWLDK
jgi:peptide/nickel transport system substrate-binding protein